MKRIDKRHDSEVVRQNLSYTKGDNSGLRKILMWEQKRFCAYTEEYIGENDACDIEHFNPNLKFTPQDSYNNWYVVKHKPNNLKSTKWIEPILYLYDEEFETRIKYSDGAYIHAQEDHEAKNLLELLGVNKLEQVTLRKKYIARRRELIDFLNINAREYFEEEIEKEIESIKYLRAIQEEFEIPIWDMIPFPEIN
ncbi:HNH endonuclease domain-containing protein [Flavobacterium sp.]|jgi:hypothetical protein|uniref:HNH endonuclease domain-containing protein n=1 Tax=Flavobacterium sp. TaxID=239 RepID=UPI0022BE6916|nr:HNH endonuclease domain-containing protein [Flavobacterium sp.]MCZ8144413.1 hypothetical protein [Flavobacterium sp.]MCZ8366596.1 hypothetical protein [Flavobacterium sp.]